MRVSVSLQLSWQLELPTTHSATIPVAMKVCVMQRILHTQAQVRMPLQQSTHHAIQQHIQPLRTTTPSPHRLLTLSLTLTLTRTLTLTPTLTLTHAELPQLPQPHPQRIVAPQHLAHVCVIAAAAATAGRVRQLVSPIGSRLLGCCACCRVDAVLDEGAKEDGLLDDVLRAPCGRVALG